MADVTNLMIHPNDHNLQGIAVGIGSVLIVFTATLLVFRAALYGQMGEYFKALQDIHRSIQLDDSVVSDEQINFFITQLTEIEISKVQTAITRHGIN